MPTGPFKQLGVWEVKEHNGLTPKGGASAKITIVKATDKFIKFTRKCAEFDPKGARLRHGKVRRWAPGVYRASVGCFQHVEVKV